jgi:hypothetical protein
VVKQGNALSTLGYLTLPVPISSVGRSDLQKSCSDGCGGSGRS